MTGDFFTFDNGRDKRRVDYDQFLAGLDQLGDLSENAELQKIFSVFDERGNGNGKIDTESEALELFGFIKQMSGPDEILQQEEISNWLQSKEDLNDDEKANIFAAVNSFMNELPDDAEISYTDGRITRRVKNGVVKEYIYHEAENGKDAYVEIIGGENRFFVSEINEDGTLNNNSKILHSEINGVVKDYVYHEAQDGEPACVEIILNGQNRYYYDTVDSYGNPADGCKLLKKEERGLVTEYVYHDAIGNEPAYVEVKTANNGTFKVLNVGLKGEFSYSDFISHEYINDENQKVTECYLQVDDMNLISERVELANNKVLTKVYGTSSYFDYYYHVKLMNDRECMQFYEEGNDEYCVYYDKNNNTITHAAYGDTVDSLIEKFGFESPEQFYELNPKLKDKEIKAADYIIVPGYYTANSPEILRQGTMQGEWDKFYKANLQSIRDEYFPNIEDELMYAMQDVEGFKVSQQTAQMYTKVNALDTDKRNIVLECIQNRARTDGAEEIKSKLYREYGINLYDDVSFNIPASSPQYTPDVLKYLTAKTFANNVEAASILFVNNTQRAGLVTDFVIDVNERFFDDDSRTQISRMLRCDRTSAILLEQASLGRLTKKDYYDIKMNLALSLLPRDASEADRNREYWRQDDNLKRALGDLTPEQLDAYIYSLAEMSDEEYEEMAPQMYEHLCEYAKNIVLREETQIPDFPQFSRLNPLGNGDLSISGRLGNTLVWPQMTFEEVFQLEMRVAYSAENMQDYFTKQDKFTLVARLYHEKEYIGGILRDAGSLATYPYGSEQNLGSAESQLLYALKELCGDDTEKINQLLASLGFSNIRLSESAFQSPVEMSEDGSISLALYNQRGLFSYYSEQEPLDIEELAEELHKPSNLYPMFGDGSGNLSGETIGAICQALISRLNSNYAIATEGKSLDYYKTQMDAAYREAFGYNNTERTVENYVKDLRSDVSTLEDIVTYAGAVILIGEQIIPVAGQYAAALEIAGYTLLFGNVALKTLDATTKEGGMTEEDRQEIAMALLGDLETVVMMGLTPLISKGFTKLGDVILTKTCPNLALKAALSKTIEGTTSWSLRTLNATRMVANSALTFGTWEALSGAGHYMIGMSNEESLGDAVVHGFGHGALFGTYMGLTGMGIRYLTGNMTKGIFKNKLPQVEEASEAALRQAESAFSEAQNFSGSQILNTYNSAFTNAMTHEGARVFSEATNFIMEVGAFTAYDVVGSLITNSKPEDLSWGEYIWETTKGQATNLLKLKALGYVMASHRLNSRASELFPNELKSEQDLYIEKVIRGGETKYEVRYPDGHRVTASNVSEVLNLANMHQQQVFLYDPLDKLLDEEGGTLDIGDGMRLVKDENGYGVEFSDHRRVNGTDLRSTIATANKIYTFEVNEQILKRDGQLTLYGQDYFYDKNTKQYRTQVDDNTLLVSESFMDVFNESISFRMSKFVEDSFASGKNAIMVDHNVFITKEGDEYRVVYLTENGEPFSPIGGNTVKEVIDQLFNETANPYTIYDKAHSEGVSYVEYTNPTENTNPLTNETGLTIYGDRTTGVNPNQTLTLPEGNEQLPPGYSIERAETGGKSEQHTSVDKVMQEGLSNDHNALFYNARKENPVWGSDIVESFGNPSMVAETPEQLYARAVERLKENTSLSEREIKDLAYYGINIREEEIQNLIIQCAQNGVDYSAYARFCSENIDGVRLQSAEVKERADFIRRAMENGLNSDDIGDLLSQYENVSKGELDGLLTEYTQRAEVTRATQEQFEAKRNGVIQRTNDAQTQRVIQEIIESSVCTEDNFDKIADLIGDNPNLARVNIIKQFIEGLPEANSRYNRQFTLDDLETFFDNVLDPEILSDFERLGNGAVLRDVMLIESGQQGQRSTFDNVRAELKLILNRSVDDVQSISSLPENEQTIVIEHAKETLRGQDDWLRLCTNNSGDFVAQDCFIAEYLYNLGIPAYEARYYMGNMERGPKMFEQLQAVRDFGRSRLNSVPDEIFDRNKMTDVLQQFGYMPDGNGNYVVNYDLGQRVNNQGETRIYNLSANDVEIMNRMINIGDHKDFWKDMSPEKFIQTFVQFKNLFEIDMVSGKSIIGEYGEEFFNGIIKELKDSDITLAEKRAIDNFVADNYQQINRAIEAMRTNRPLQTAEAMFAEDAQNLYNLIQRHTVSTDIELNRTERDPNRFDEVKLSDGTTLTQILNNFELYADRIDEINEELSNNPLHNDRFMSTALGSEQVMSGGLNWKVHLEEGSNAMFRNVYSETSQGEFEYIIQAGSDTTFRIEVITANDGRKYPQLVGYVTTPRDGAIGTGTEGTTEIFGTTGATDVNRSIASGENVADAPIRLTENVPVTPDEAKRMLIEAGFPESELEDIDFNNPAVLINTPAFLCAMRLKAFEFFENFDVNDNSEPGLERRREFYEQLSEISDDNTGFVRYLNDENVNTIRKYFEFGNEEDLDNIIGFFALGDRPHISEKIMQILPEMTRNGQRKLTVDEVKNLRYIQDELVPYLTPERARFAEMINSQIDNAQFKIKIFEFDRLGPDENLTEDFANRYVSAVRRLEELHIDTTDKFNETIQQDLARMEAIVAFMDRYNFDLNGTEDNWIFSSNVENLMARNDIAELQEYFNALVPEARHFGLRRLPKEGLSFQDYADLCNYLVTEPDLFEGINPYLNTACIMRFITDNNVTDIKGFTELIKSLKGTEMLKGYEYKFRDRVKNVPNQEYEAASRVINELKLIYEKPEDAEELDRTLTFVFDKFRNHDIDNMAQKLRYLREQGLAEDAKEHLFSILDAEAPGVENSAVRNISEEVLMDRIRHATRREDFTEIRDQLADMPTDTPEQLEAKQRLQLVY
ncbi:hypothetical protein J6S88_06210, partial [bacterium]|nr:hypothetical protein [bacterium]